MIIAAFCLGGIIGYLIHGNPGAAYGLCISGILTELIGAVYIFYFAAKT